MAINKDYVNYNLSLVNPNEIIIKTPIEEKIEIKISAENPSNLKDDVITTIPDAPTFDKDSPSVIILDPIEDKIGTEVETEELAETPKENVEIEIEEANDEKLEYGVMLKNPREKKEEIEFAESKIYTTEKKERRIDIYNAVEPRISAEEESKIDIDSKGLNLLLAKEYPVEGFDDEVMTHKLRDQTWDGSVAPVTPSDQDYSMGDFKVTKENKGKKEVPVEKQEKLKNNFEVKVLDQEYEKTKPKDSPSQYNRFKLREEESGRDPSSDEGFIIDNKIDIKILDQEYEKTKPIETATRYNTWNITSTETSKDDSVDIMDLSSFANSKLVKTPYEDKSLTYSQLLKSINTKEDDSNLGSLHVYPANIDTEGGIEAKYVIPFEFNPKITESGYSAKYETASLLSRVGDIQAYIKTDSTNITLNTKYQVLSSEEIIEKDSSGQYTGDQDGVGSWMVKYHLRNIQNIEMAYRGLVFPQTSKKAGSFFRPPVIKIVFGNSKKATEGSIDGSRITKKTPFNNMLTYPYKLARETKVYYKTFVATKVDIRKDWDNYPVILNESLNGILDLQGFDVSVNLIEIDPMFIGVLPSFEDYYSTLNSGKSGVTR